MKFCIQYTSFYTLYKTMKFCILYDVTLYKTMKFCFHVTLKKLYFHFLSNWMGYDRGNSFPFDFLNQMDFHLVQNRKENCPHDHIPFNLKGNGILFYQCHEIIAIWRFLPFKGYAVTHWSARQCHGIDILHLLAMTFCLDVSKYQVKAASVTQKKTCITKKIWSSRAEKLLFL